MYLVNATPVLPTHSDFNCESRIENHNPSYTPHKACRPDPRTDSHNNVSVPTSIAVNPAIDRHYLASAKYVNQRAAPCVPVFSHNGNETQKTTHTAATATNSEQNLPTPFAVPVSSTVDFSICKPQNPDNSYQGNNNNSDNVPVHSATPATFPSMTSHDVPPRLPSPILATPKSETSFQSSSPNPRHWEVSEVSDITTSFNTSIRNTPLAHFTTNATPLPPNSKQVPSISGHNESHSNLYSWHPPIPGDGKLRISNVPLPAQNPNDRDAKSIKLLMTTTANSQVLAARASYPSTGHQNAKVHHNDIVHFEQFENWKSAATTESDTLQRNKKVSAHLCDLMSKKDIAAQIPTIDDPQRQAINATPSTQSNSFVNSSNVAHLRRGFNGLKQSGQVNNELNAQLTTLGFNPFATSTSGTNSDSNSDDSARANQAHISHDGRLLNNDTYNNHDAVSSRHDLSTSSTLEDNHQTLQHHLQRPQRQTHHQRHAFERLPESQQHHITTCHPTLATAIIDAYDKPLLTSIVSPTVAETTAKSQNDTIQLKVFPHFPQSNTSTPFPHNQGVHAISHNDESLSRQTFSIDNRTQEPFPTNLIGLALSYPVMD
ncbi:hypothetical protein HDU99_002327 [Rhizoclosmatium hyalinum]|nr:hypothetical protein HDU99_002327 [Rhizoclosmatium hyalinum]